MGYHSRKVNSLGWGKIENPSGPRLVVKNRWNFSLGGLQRGSKLEKNNHCGMFELFSGSNQTNCYEYFVVPKIESLEETRHKKVSQWSNFWLKTFLIGIRALWGLGVRINHRSSTYKVPFYWRHDSQYTKWKACLTKSKVKFCNHFVLFRSQNHYLNIVYCQESLLILTSTNGISIFLSEQ